MTWEYASTRDHESTRAERQSRERAAEVSQTMWAAMGNGGDGASTATHSADRHSHRTHNHRSKENVGGVDGAINSADDGATSTDGKTLNLGDKDSVHRLYGSSSDLSPPATATDSISATSPPITTTDSALPTTTSTTTTDSTTPVTTPTITTDSTTPATTPTTTTDSTLPTTTADSTVPSTGSATTSDATTSETTTSTASASTATDSTAGGASTPTTYGLIPASNTAQIAGGPAVNAGEQYTVTPMTTAQLQEQMEGVNTHFAWPDSNYSSDFATVDQNLENTGIKTIRDAIPDGDPQLVSNYATLSSQGISGIGILNQSIPASEEVAAIQSSNAQDGNFLKAIEGPNEENSNDPTWATDGGAAATASYMTQFAQAASAAGLDIPIISPSMDTINSSVVAADSQAVASAGVSGITSAVSVHAYDLSGYPEDGMLSTNLAYNANAYPGQPQIVTEEGWTQTGSPGYTAEPTVQAKDDSRALLTNAANGVPTYLYQLADTNVADDGTWGLYNVQGQANPAGTTISNMNQILDNGSSTPDANTTPTALSYNITGNTANVNQLVVQNGNSTDLVLWLGDQSGDSVQQQQTQLNLSGAAVNASIYDPTNGTTATASYQNTNKIPVDVEDQPIIIQLQNA